MGSSLCPDHPQPDSLSDRREKRAQRPFVLLCLPTCTRRSACTQMLHMLPMACFYFCPAVQSIHVRKRLSRCALRDDWAATPWQLVCDVPLLSAAASLVQEMCDLGAGEKRVIRAPDRSCDSCIFSPIPSIGTMCLSTTAGWLACLPAHQQVEERCRDVDVKIRTVDLRAQYVKSGGDKLTRVGGQSS